MSRSMFYSHFKYFDEAVKHPEMLAWLEQDEDILDVDVWGKKKAHYTFVDLVNWLRDVDDVDVGASTSDGGKKKGKKPKEKQKRRNSPQKDGEKKSHKAKAKSGESSKKGSKK